MSHFVSLDLLINCAASDMSGLPLSRPWFVNEATKVKAGVQSALEQVLARKILSEQEASQLGRELRSTIDTGFGRRTSSILSILHTCSVTSRSPMLYSCRCHTACVPCTLVPGFGCRHADKILENCSSFKDDVFLVCENHPYTISNILVHTPSITGISMFFFPGCI